MKVVVGDREFNVTWKSVTVALTLLGLLFGAFKWYQATQESNKLVPVLRAQVGDMKVEIDDRAEEIEENVEAIEGLTEAVEEQGEQLDGMETNQVIIMRELGVEPVRNP
jgi:hypothetical protein